MATISRPGKEGNATSYQGKVAAGYTKILAQEVDADIDAIYTAWNQGVDTVNIKDGSVTAPKLAPGAILPSALSPGSVGTAALADGSVTSAKIVNGTIVGADIAAGTLTDSLIANVAWSKLIAPLIGTLLLTPRVLVTAAGGSLDILANASNSDQYDGGKPSWLLRLDHSNDGFQIWRSPPPGNAYAMIFSMAADGHFTTPVTRASLGVNAISGSAVTAYCPGGFSVPAPNQWTTVVTLPALTTRGGYVHIHANHTLSGYGPPGGVSCSQRLLRDGSGILQQSFIIASPNSQTSIPWPPLAWVDTSVPAGTHTYTHQVLVGGGAICISTGGSDGGYMAIEIG